jgi:hypothetical protein
LAPFLWPEAVHRGTRTMVGMVCCPWAQCSSSPGSLCRPARYWMHYRQHQWSLFCECNTESSRISSPYSASVHSTSCCLLELRLCIRQGPILALAAECPSSYFCFLWQGFLLPPVSWCLCHLSQEMLIAWCWLERAALGFELRAHTC